MNNQQLGEKLEKNLQLHLRQQLPSHPISEVYHYAVFPPGKLFRPRLVWAISMDFASSKEKQTFADWHPQLPQAHLASAMEFHHAYTLVHDDLPCMDNDDFRRNKPSTHRAYGQWQALLVGDGLLNASYGQLAKISHPHLSQILSWASFLLGAKGLIQGQVLDLSLEMQKDFPTLATTHEFKTARLIQCCLIGSFLLLERSTLPGGRRILWDLFKLGKEMGLVFQLLDDLTELNTAKVNEHEQAVNPWINFSQQAWQRLLLGMEKIGHFQGKHHCPHFGLMVQEYYRQIAQLLVPNLSLVETRSTQNLNPLIVLLNATNR